MREFFCKRFGSKIQMSWNQTLKQGAKIYLNLQKAWCAPITYISNYIVKSVKHSHIPRQHSMPTLCISGPWWVSTSRTMIQWPLDVKCNIFLMTSVPSLPFPPWNGILPVPNQLVCVRKTHDTYWQGLQQFPYESLSFHLGLSLPLKHTYHLKQSISIITTIRCYLKQQISLPKIHIFSFTVYSM